MDAVLDALLLSFDGGLISKEELYYHFKNIYILHQTARVGSSKVVVVRYCSKLQF